jgi:hypothetical protein
MHHGRAVRQWIMPVWLLRLRRWQEDESSQLPPRVSPAVQVLGCVQDLAQQRAVGGRTQVCAMPWSSPSYMPACPTVCVHVPSEVALRFSRCYHLCPYPSLHVRMPACTGSWLYVRTLVGRSRGRRCGRKRPRWKRWPAPLSARGVCVRACRQRG